MAVEDRVVLSAGSFADAVRWPFERIAWAVENWLVWPIQEETALWSRLTKSLVAAAVVLLAGGAIAAGIVLSNPSDGTEQVSTLKGPSASTAAAAHVRGAHHAAPVPKGPVLHGSAPSFAPESGEGVPKSAEKEILRSETGKAHSAPAEAPQHSSGSRTAPTTGAPEVAGPAAIKVAREFSEAFVLYEIGRDTPKVKKAIAATASPDLTKALLRRPPRLPSNVKVPKARVLNIVAGPAQGSTYTVSVSLLRVGVTSELRLDMKLVPPAGGAGGQESGREAKKQWQVTDVLG